MTSVPSSPLSRTMAMTASSLDGPVDVDELLHLICLAAIDSVPGAEYAGVTMADRHGKLETRAATHISHQSWSEKRSHDGAVQDVTRPESRQLERPNETSLLTLGRQALGEAPR